MKRFPIVGLAVSLTLLTGTAVAQDSEGLEEIVVTATKREQTLQDVPVAVSVTSVETINNAAIQDVADLDSIIPSLRINTLQTSTNTNFIIRGFGNGANNPGIEPSVGVFIDGVSRSRSPRRYLTRRGAPRSSEHAVRTERLGRRHQRHHAEAAV